MRVLQINSVCGVGSTGRIATDIHQILIENGHESFVAYGRGLPLNCNNAIKIGSKIDNYAHVMSTRLFDLHGFASKNATHEFVEKIKVLDPDIIHLHNLHGYYINIEILFDFLIDFNKPIVWTLHDCWSFTGHCVYYDYSNCSKWKSGCFNCPEKKSYPKSILVDNSSGNYASKKVIFNEVGKMTIITPSKWLMSQISESFLKQHPIKVINNGINLNIFKVTVSDFKLNYKIEDKFVILGVASVWDRRKGFNYFIELSNYIKKDDVIVLVGLSEKQLENIPNNIIGIKKTNSAMELAELYSCADVFVNPTLEDNFPTTNIEAMACGTPVVTFRTGGSPESICQNTGIVTESKDAYSLYKSILTIKKHGKKTFSEYCVSKSLEFYNSTDRYKEYLEFYKTLL